MPQEQELKRRNPYRLRGGAEEASTSSLTIENPAEGHQYKAYQVFKGTVSSDGTKLSNVQYGANYAGREGMALGEELAELEAEGADAKAFAEAVKGLLTGEPAAVLTKESPAAELEAGYYIIIDESAYEGSGDSLSDYIVTVAGNVKVQPKSTGVPGFDKSIDEGEDGPQERHTISVEDTEPGHSCEIYQIFTGTAGEGGEITDLKYGANYGTEGSPVPEDVASSIGTQVFVDQVRQEVSGTPAAVLTAESPSVDAAAGYYLAVDKDEEGNEAEYELAAVSGDKIISINHDSQAVDLSPETADIDWNYTLHEDTGIITLNYYTGAKTDVKVYSHYKVPDDDRVYKAELASNNENKSENYMFAKQRDIKSIVFSDYIDTKTCVNMSYMFYLCTSLNSINFGENFDTQNVISMNYMFGMCVKIYNLDVTKFNTINVISMEGMFCGGSFNTIDLSAFNTENVENLSDMFSSCSNLKYINLSNFNTKKCTDMSNMFAFCDSLANIDISKWDTENVQNMEGMFAFCKSITDINLSNFNTKKCTNMNEMFEGCSSIINLDLTSFDTSNVDSMSFIFKDSINISVIYVTNGKWILPDNGYGDYEMFSNCGVSSVTYKDQLTAESLPLYFIDMVDKVSAISAGIFPEAHADVLKTETVIQPETAASSDAIEIEDDDTSVSYGIGDSIPYKLTATMPEAITAYKKYKLVFHDKLSAGLDYSRDSLKVFAGSTEIPAENYTVAYSEDGKSLTVSINDAKAAPWNAVPGTEISVKYSAVLNENAEVKNRNEAYLEYSNDPKGDGTGETGPGVPDTVDVYTFEIRFDKVDKNGDPLAGAGFTLYKKDETDVFQPFGEEVKGMTRFSFKGLAAGEYKLAETATPDGYNTMEDFVFRIDAETADGTDGKVKRITMVSVSGGAGAWTAVAADMAFESDIANYTGSTLPSTGGMGTYAFYLAGAAVVVIVGTVMTAKKKEDKE